MHRSRCLSPRPAAPASPPTQGAARGRQTVSLIQFPVLLLLLVLVLIPVAPPAGAYLYDTFGSGPGWPNRLDDRIDAMLPHEYVDIIVDFCSTPLPADSTFLAAYGQIYGVFRFIDAIAVRNVLVADCFAILGNPRVKLIEWDQSLQLHVDISACAIQARASGVYPFPTQAVWDLNPPRGYMGNGINIAIVDSGVDDSHPALAGKFVAGYDGMTGQGGPGVNPDDDMVGWYHGTAVAGMIMGNDPAQQYMGVAPNAGLIDCKIFDAQGNSPASRAIAALHWIMQNAATFNITVANCSFGGFPDDGTDALARAGNALAQSGVVVVASAGNNPPATGISSPASGDDVICVGGVDDRATILRADDIFDPLARIGPRNSPPPTYVLGFNDLKPEVSAYMRDITTCQGSNPGQGGAGFWQHPGIGTSWATAHTSGVVALLLEKYPGLSPAQVNNMLRMNAEPRGGPTYPGLDPIWDNQYGWGIVSAANTVNAVLPVDVSVTPWIPGTWNSNAIWAGHYPLRVDDPNSLNARIYAKGGPAAGVHVHFDVMNTGWGLPWSQVGTVIVNVPWDGSTVATLPYTPPPGMEGHKCFRVRAVFPPDTNPANNTAQENIDVQPARGRDAEVSYREEQRYVFPIMIGVEESTPFPFRTAEACICTRDLPDGADAWLEPPPPFDLAPGQIQICSLIVDAPPEVEFQAGHSVHVNGWFWGNGIAEGGVSIYFHAPPPIEATIAEVQTTDDPAGSSPLMGQAVTVRGIATTDSWTYPERFAIQDGVGPWSGLFVRSAPGYPVDRGDELTVTGTVVETEGLTELDFVSALEVEATGQPLPPPAVLDPSVIDTSEEYEGVLVRVENVTVVDDNPDDWAVESNGICRVGRWGDYSYMPIVGDLLNVSGVSGALAELHKLQPRDDDDISCESAVEPEPRPAVLALARSSPNPFSGSATIAYALPVDGRVRLEIYSVDGRRVRTLLSGWRPAGEGTVIWDGTDNAGARAPSGIYFYVLAADGGTISRRMLMLE